MNIIVVVIIFIGIISWFTMDYKKVKKKKDVAQMVNK